MAIKYIDAHTHPIKEYYKDNFQVIEKARSKNLVAMMVTGCDEKENEEVKNICKYFDYCHAVIGIHPTLTTGKEDAKIVEKQIDESVVAIGEIGLDYYYSETNKKIQKKSLIAQIEVAKKHHLPVVIHMRDSYEDLFEILKKYTPEVKFMIHTWSGSLEWAKKFLEIGCYFSFSGGLTYKNSDELIEVVKYLPIEKILTETDAPYLAPAIKRGEINYPNYVIHTANFLAGIKQIPLEKLTDQIIKNTNELFNLKISRK